MDSNANIARVSSILSTADGQEKFLVWFKDEMTQTMLAAAKELAHPRMELNPDASHALQENGRIIGAYEVIDFLTNPQIGVGVDVSKPQVPLRATYGSEKIIKEDARNG